MTNVMGSKKEQLFKKRLVRLTTTSENNQPRTSSIHMAEALTDLYQLLEEYGPSWYTEEHRRKAEVALGKYLLIS